MGNFLPRYLVEAEKLRSNSGQWEIYQSKGSCVVLAGPGSGKTKAVTVKVAQLLHEELKSPRGLACITYSSECARELHRRFIELGVDHFRNLFVGTIHGFCMRHILIPFGHLSGGIVPHSFQVAKDSVQKVYLQKAYEEIIDQQQKIESVQLEMSRYRRLSCDGLVSTTKADPEFDQLIPEYLKRLHQAGFIDFDDMVLGALKIVRRFEWAKKIIEAKFPIVVVDEYQDLGEPLHQLVQDLCIRGRSRLIAIGDPDQSVYDFNGAKPGLLLDLSKLTQVTKIELKLNYRCGRVITDSSSSILEETRPYFSPDNHHDGQIVFTDVPTGFDGQVEKIFSELIPEELRKDSSLTLGKMAVLYMNKNEGDLISSFAISSGTKYIRSDQNAAYQKTQYTRLLEDCAKWCSEGWRTGNPRISSLIASVRSLLDGAFFKNDDEDIGALLVKSLWTLRDGNKPLHEWLAYVQTNLIDVLNKYVRRADEIESVNKLIKIVHSPAGSLRDFSVQDFASQTGARDHINLMTFYAAKGCEFDVVFIPGLDEGRLPWLNQSEDRLKEQRRLFFVGVTRAKRTVHVLYSGFTMRNGRQQRNGVSRFVSDLKAALQE